MRETPYDQRVAALVEVRGGSYDWEEAERRFEAHGWPVRASHPTGSGPTAGVLPPDPASRIYEVEVRLPGAARGSARGAAYRVAKMLRGACLEGYVRRTERIVRDRETVSQWQVFRTAHRTPPPATGNQRRLRRWMERLRRYDIGASVAGRPAQALRLARTSAAGGYDASAPFAVRPLDGRWRELSLYWPEDETDRRLRVVLLWALTVGVSLAFAQGRGVPGQVWWYAVAACALARALWCGSRLFRPVSVRPVPVQQVPVRASGAANGSGTPSRTGARSRFSTQVRGATLALLACVIFTLIALRGTGSGEARVRGQLAVTMVLVVVAGGLWLLMRQWTWGEWAAWVIPLVVTLATSSLLTAGSLLHSLYADGFGLSADELDVPSIWQLVATAKLVQLFSLVLTLPAAWGYARHFHYSRATPGDGFNGIGYLLLLVLLLVSGAGLALDSAATAVNRTEAAARDHADALPSYFGVQPEWTCAQPVVPNAQLASRGPRLDPSRPYVLFAVTDDTAILWDPASGKPLKLPAGQVRLVLSKSASQRCVSG